MTAMSKVFKIVITAEVVRSEPLKVCYSAASCVAVKKNHVVELDLLYSWAICHIAVSCVALTVDMQTLLRLSHYMTFVSRSFCSIIHGYFYNSRHVRTSEMGSVCGLC